MGDLADHVAKTALRRLPTAAVPEELRPVIRDMGTAADRIAGKIARGAAQRGRRRAPPSWSATTTRSTSWRSSSSACCWVAAWRHGVEPAIDAALLGRWYERFADHAVNAGREVMYFVAGGDPGR